MRLNQVQTDIVNCTDVRLKVLKQIIPHRRNTGKYNINLTQL